MKKPWARGRRNTVERMLAEAGSSRARDRRRGMSWKTSLRTHWEIVAAVRPSGLRRAITDFAEDAI